MRDTSYTTLWDTNCIIIEEDDGFFLIPQNKEESNRIKSHFGEQDFILRYNGGIGFNSVAFVERMQSQINHAVRIYPQYIINRCHAETFTSMEITGEVFDDFFSPAHYFYDRMKSDSKANVDFIYHSEVADQWAVNFEDRPITVKVSYGDILQRGTASDLKLHPKLTIEFDQTTDIQYVYRIYTFIVRFVRMIRYDINCGELKIELFDNKNGKRYHNGYLRVFSEDNGKIYVTNHEVEYGCYKPYIQRFLQFAADNPMYTFYHYPTKGIRYRGIHYSAVDYMNIFSAFEAECHANENTYENIDASKVQKIKDILVTQLENFPRDGLEKEEIDFIDNARKRITQLGTQFGQSKKIVNAYQVLHNALDGSIKYIFFLPKQKLEGPLQLKDLNRIAGYLAGKRGAVAHGGFSGVFSDVDARKIHFLEILTYAQMLRRMGLDDADIERIVGAIFGCNYVWVQEKYQ